MKLFALVLAVALGSAAYAQPNAYFRSNGQFVAGGNEYPRNFWTGGLKDADEVFKVHPEALKAYDAHLEYAKWFGILNWGALGALAIYAVAAGDDYEGGVGALVFAVPWISGIFVGAKSQAQLIKAVNIVNGVPVNQARQPREPGALKVSLLSWSF